MVLDGFDHDVCLGGEINFDWSKPMKNRGSLQRCKIKGLVIIRIHYLRAFDCCSNFFSTATRSFVNISEQELGTVRAHIT